MSDTYQSQRRPRQPRQDCDPCKAPENQTQKIIVNERKKICDLLYESVGNLSKQEIKYRGEKKIYKDKKCLFKWTEENYQRHRNFDIIVGTELTQTNESVKANVEAYNTWNKTLSETLKGIAKQVKDVKTKFSEFHDFTCKLNKCLKDKCHIAQVKALTGVSPANPDCDPTEPISDCKDSQAILDELICIPGGLLADIDSLFQSSHDVVGIQVFSNIDSLSLLQKTLEQQSKDFGKHITDVVKTREGDLKKQQEELVKSVQELTKAAMDRNYARSEYEGYMDAVDFLCCPICDCVITKPANNNKNSDCKDCPPRLKDCEECICDICKQVKKAFCCKPEEPKKEKNAQAD